MFDFLFGYPVIGPTTHSSTKEPLLAGPCLLLQSLNKAWPSQRPFDLNGCSKWPRCQNWQENRNPAAPIRLGSRYLLVITSCGIRNRFPQLQSDLRALADAKRPYETPTPMSVWFARMNGRSASFGVPYIRALAKGCLCIAMRGRGFSRHNQARLFTCAACEE